MESPLTISNQLPDLAFTENLRKRIQVNLNSHPRIDSNNASLRKAAVAVIIVPSTKGKAGFVLTRRSRGLRNHSHQYALPGGRIDPGETRQDTVLREVNEEIGILTDKSQIIGTLDDYETRSGFSITPIVLWIEDLSDLSAEPDEVDEIFLIDLEELFRSDSPRWVEIEESSNRVLQLPIRNRLIHAPTAALLYQFREVGLAGKFMRTDNIEEPVWAWK